MKKVITVLLFIVLMGSCAKEGNDGFDEDLQGKWILTRVLCYCGFGENPDFSGHTLTFDALDLKVENSGEFSFLTDASGEYSTTGNLITFRNGRQYTYNVVSNILELTFVDHPSISDDELFLEYRRE